MKLGIFSDLHLHNHKPFSRPTGAPGINSRANSCLCVLIEIIEMSRRREIDAVLFCGDFWDLRGFIWVPLFHEAYSLLRELSKRVAVVMIKGNHDLATSEENTPSGVDVFRTVGGVHVLDKTHQRVYLGGKRVYVCGISADEGLEDLREPAPPGICSVLLMHTMIEGVKITDKYNAESGLSLTRLRKFMDKNNFHRCFIGDVHLRQDVAPNIHYVGSVIQKSFSDAGQHKGMTIYDTKKNTIKFRRIVSPEFRTRNQVPEHLGKDYWKITPQNKEEHDIAKKGRTFRVRIIPPEKAHKVRSNITVGTSHDDALVEYVHSKLPVGSGDAKRMVRLGRKYMIPETKI